MWSSEKRGKKVDSTHGAIPELTALYFKRRKGPKELSARESLRRSEQRWIRDGGGRRKTLADGSFRWMLGGGSRFPEGPATLACRDSKGFFYQKTKIEMGGKMDVLNEGGGGRFREKNKGLSHARLGPWRSLERGPCLS